MTRDDRRAGLLARAPAREHAEAAHDGQDAALGRPNRDQIVSVRPLELTTLEAIDLSNGEELAAMLRQGASHLAARNWQSPDEFIRWLYHFALSRDPTADELRILTEAAGPELTEPVVEDILWSVLMLPEFQLVR